MATNEEEHGDDESAEPEQQVGAYRTERTTAPQSPYTTRDVAVGLAVLAVGLVITFAVPLALA